jgi:hypothetical protein
MQTMCKISLHISQKTRLVNNFTLVIIRNTQTHCVRKMQSFGMLNEVICIIITLPEKVNACLMPVHLHFILSCRPILKAYKISYGSRLGKQMLYVSLSVSSTVCMWCIHVYLHCVISIK